MKKSSIQVHEHEVWQNDRQHRRVCGVLGDRVYYSRGGDSTLSCKIARFRTWVRSTKAVCVNPRAPT